jgi:hypothetical protein
LIVCCIYLILLLLLIRYNGFFGIFNDSKITRRQFGLFLFLKALAIPVFYILYQKMYGGIEKFDAGKFYHDAKIINGIATKDFALYLRILFGLQNDSPLSYDFLMLTDTVNWDNGIVKDFLYNDNRVLIRVHSVVHFIAFNSYFVHALFSCFLSYIGIVFLYKTLQEFFAGKELWVLMVLCFFPGLWFYTGALLKEGLVFFVFGCGIYQLKKFSHNTITLKGSALLIFLVFVSLFLKPYLLFFGFIYFTSLFLIYRKIKNNYRLVSFILIILGSVFILNALALLVRKKSLIEAAYTHQRIFAGAAKGGIFLANDYRYVELPYDTTFIKKVPGKKDIFTLKKNISYVYHEKSTGYDTLNCSSNNDTLTHYSLVYKIPESTSNIDLGKYSQNPIILAASCLYYSLCYPLFYNARNPLQFLASFENILLLLSLANTCFYLIIGEKERFLPFGFLLFALILCLLIGLTTPNSGAIFRYRSPVVIFILLSALYYIEGFTTKKFKDSG